ncbi:MAG: NAD(P)H-dependent oxidoreductase subunit E [Ornithinimicrobium sp.]
MSAQIDTNTRGHTVRAIAQGQAQERGPLLVVLHAVQAELGYIDTADLPVIADVLNLSVAEVHGVVSFYKDFRTDQPSARVLQVCRAEACQAVGAQGVFDAATRAASARTDLEVEEIFCFGNCALGPTVCLDGRLHGRMTEDRVGSVIGPES